MTDTKRITPAILAQPEMDIESVDRSLRRRIVVQIYHRGELDFTLEAERRNGPFGGIIFTLYQTRISNEDLLLFVEATGLEWITASKTRFNLELASKLHDLGARVFVHTLNKPQAIRRFQESGADGIYTDNFHPGRSN